MHKSIENHLREPIFHQVLVRDNYWAIRLAANPSNPAHEVTFPPNYVDLNEQNPKAIKSFGIRTSPLLESANSSLV